jgi:hypothetical protein
LTGEGFSSVGGGLVDRIGETPNTRGYPLIGHLVPPRLLFKHSKEAAPFIVSGSHDGRQPGPSLNKSRECSRTAALVSGSRTDPPETVETLNFSSQQYLEGACKPVGLITPLLQLPRRRA